MTIPIAQSRLGATGRRAGNSSHADTAEMKIVASATFEGAVFQPSQTRSEMVRVR